MAVSRGGDAIIAAGPTELRRYLPVSLIATALVAGVPVWAVLTFGERLGLLATILSIGLSFGLAHLGSIAWTRWPGSRDVVFNDLMLWGFMRRLVTQRRLIRRVERLGFTTTNDPDEMTLEERTKLLKRLAEGLEAGDPYTHGHSQRVARHAYMVAKTMKLPRRDAEKIRLAGVMHDIGKLRIPREIITKPGALTDDEFEVIKRHTIDGAAMVEVLGDPQVTDMVRHHHERLDGTGYPDKLTGDAISIGARVLAVADTFDAASSLRPYRAAQKHKVALDIIEKEAAAGKLDPDVVEAFVRYYSGRRALKWWTVISAGPAHLQDLPFAFVQRVSAAGLANAAVAGVTAVALAPGSPLHGGRVADRDVPRNERAVVQTSQDREVGMDDTSTDAASEATGERAGAREDKRVRGRGKGSNGKSSNGKSSKDRKRPPSNPSKGPKDRSNAAPSQAGPKDKGSEKDRGGPSKETEPAGGAVAGAVDSTAEEATGAVGGGVKNGNSDKDAETVTTAPETETVTEEAPAVPETTTPGNPGGKDKGK